MKTKIQFLLSTKCWILVKSKTSKLKVYSNENIKYAYAFLPWDNSPNNPVLVILKKCITRTGYMSLSLYIRMDVPYSTSQCKPRHNIASCDIGTTALKVYIYSEKAEVRGKAGEQVTLLYPHTGHVEIDPEDLWKKFLSVLNEAIQDARLQPTDIDCIGLSTQRGTFVTWNKETGIPFHNFITWKDIRADSLVSKWNDSLTMKAIHLGSSILYSLLKKKRYLAASVLWFQNIQVTLRLKWAIDNIPELKCNMKVNNVMFGTVDTWLVYKLTGGKVYATDYSNASGTALYDPFLLEWSNLMEFLFKISPSIFPKVRSSVGFWGETCVGLLGASIPITAVVSDQGSSMFGGCNFNEGEVKVTLGTGAFLDVNTGRKPHASIQGIYPVIGWEDAEGLVYMAEGSSLDNGSIMEWGRKIGLYDDPADSSNMATSVSSTEGVYFIPGFQGIQAPINDATATGGFIGLKAETSKEHLVRAMLESLAFRIYQIFLAMEKESNYQLVSVRADGGVSRNDFLLQTISTLTGKIIERGTCIEMSSLGCCFLAGLGAGIWNCRSDILQMKKVEKLFEPDLKLRPVLLREFQTWCSAVKRFTNWYKGKNVLKWKT